ncbi:MAG: 3-dehydroquinate synthase [Gammaproteobacteria bacterium]|nr:3-dehydroquinate synthase [Gammaproteobacteria bacterium]MCH9744390.1 3-dehydroquinate synthase [Gammaproteobacteria bacterium]
MTIKHGVGEYPIALGRNLLDDVTLFKPHLSGNNIVIISDTKVAPCHLKKLQKLLLDNKLSVFNIELNAQESGKTIETFMSIIDKLIHLKQSRDTTLIAFGGGVIGDLVGFVAACYLRGVNYIQVPTTLLAQVDSSIGGKTAINHPGGKNMIGAFHQPNAVVIDIDTLNGLPQREYNAGLAEIIKAALIKDVNFFRWLQQHIDALLARDESSLLYAIEQSCRIKRDIVQQDETEQGIRTLLNLGHTFAHAIELQLGYGAWLHGEAVAVGLVLAARLSHRLGLLNQAELMDIHDILRRCALPTRLPSTLNCATLLPAMRSDKKVLQNRLRFVLNNGIGSAIVRDDISESVLQTIIDGVQDEQHTTTGTPDRVG